MKYDLDFYASHVRVIPVEVARVIMARQGSLKGLSPVRMSYSYEEFPFIRNLPSTLNNLPFKVEALKERTTKIFSSQMGPQGLVPDIATVELLTERYFGEFHSAKEWSEIPGEEIWCDEYISVPKEQSWEASDRSVYTYLSRPKERTNSGYRGFSDSRDHELILAALKQMCIDCRTGDLLGDPLIVWYRAQHKFRTIFGDSLSNLATSVKFLIRPCNTMLFDIPSVAYSSYLVTERRINSFVRDHIYVLGLEGDFEAMDTTISPFLANEALRHVARVTTARDVSYSFAVARAHFSSPLIRIDGSVDTRQHSLLSGVFMTNGLESHINLRYQSRVASLILKELSTMAGVDLTPRYHRRFISFQLNAMGDDSALLIGLKPDGSFLRPFLDKLRNRLPELSATAAAEFGLVANVSKQRVSDDGVWFCQRYYPLTLSAKGHIRRSDSTPASIYPELRAIRNCLNPESGPSRYTKTMSCYAWDAMRMAQTLDNSNSSQYYKFCVNEMRKTIGESVILELQNFLKLSDCKEQVRKNPSFSHWRLKVVGEEWDPLTSTTIQTWLK